MPSILIRPPTFSSATAPPEWQSPTVTWLTETWHVTHSSLPMWKSKRNVRIQYTPLPPSDSSIASEHSDRIDDLVSYQSLDGDKVSTVHGIDKLADKSGDSRDSWDWRGKGLLKVASSHWEVLGYGEEDNGRKWVVTAFASTLFTPAGIDIYSQHAEGTQVETLEEVRAALSKVDDKDVKKMAADLFEIKRDGARKD
ncbi:hypothetical protein LTR78_003196 [Recurvomyces mirabilis]|uniref:Uncharacterized protein n=1 Tax=Recurvomyces mirabilis TaxID=574656 RepID=A0AAE0WS10_9PEZI|nr:hypothetical protein LTR78_003196 [Recurvomyces mirabilis]KAK5156984.1 hypothetical protein LTS14_004501 [Recurvomyces mirabilis]